MQNYCEKTKLGRSFNRQSLSSKVPSNDGSDQPKANQSEVQKHERR